MTDEIALLLVGAPHFANPGRDMVNVQFDDVLAAARQEQISAVVDTLGRFRPTKVAVEAPPGHAWLERYLRWRAGSEPLGRSETEQLGFRVAAAHGHDRVHGIDVEGVFWDDRVDAAAATDPAHAARLAALHTLGRETVAEEERLLANSTIGEVLRRLNSPEGLAALHRPYLEFMVPIVVDRGGPQDADASFPGADVVANWYRRNLHIFANLVVLAEPGDRVLVVYGAGHVPVLRWLATEHPAIDVVDPLEFLP